MVIEVVAAAATSATESASIPGHVYYAAMVWIASLAQGAHTLMPAGGMLDAAALQFDFFGAERGALGSDDPVVKGWIMSMFAVAGFGILLNIFNAGIRKKMVDQIKLKRMMKETRAWQKEKLRAARTKDDARLSELNKKSAYMNKMSMELMQMNMRPMLITFVPLILIFYFVLPWLFSYTVAVSPIPLNVIPGDMFQLTCTAEQAADPEHVCTEENAIFLWAWYFLSSIAFSGIIMKMTKTSMDLS